MSCMRFGELRLALVQLCEEIVPSIADKVGKESTHSFHFQLIADRGACGKTRVVPQNRWPKPEGAETGGSEMRALVAASRETPPVSA